MITYLPALGDSLRRLEDKRRKLKRVAFFARPFKIDHFS